MPNPPDTDSRQAAGIENRVRAEQVRFVLRNLPLGTAVTALVMATVVLLLWETTPTWQLLGWYGLVLLTQLFRLALLTRDSDPEDPDGLQQLRLALIVGAGMSGAACGSAPFLAATGAEISDQVIIFGLLGSVAAGSLGTLGALRPVYSAHLIPLVGPVVLWLTWFGGVESGMLAVVATVFTVALLSSARGYSLKLEEAYRLQYQNAALNQHLLSANAEAQAKSDRLHQEMAKRQHAERAIAAYAEKLRRSNHTLQSEIEERRQHENQVTRQALSLLDNQMRLRAVLDNTFDAIVTLDKSGKIHTVNPAAERLFGIGAEALEGRALQDFVPGFSPETEQGSRQDLEGITGAGDRFPISLARAAMRLKDETHYVCVIRDETDAHTARRALIEGKEAAEAANRAKSEFLSRMSHELRTPMNAILGFAQLLQADPDNPLAEDQAESVDQILKAGWHLLELINEVLDLAKIEAGKIEALLEDVSLSDLIAECRNLIGPLAEQRGVTLQDETLDHPVRLHADPTRLKQVILNLLSNAIKYNRPEGSVIIEAPRLAGKTCRLTITDTGIGLTPGEIDTIFQPFTRFSHNRDEVEGTGIGLAITQKLLRLMGGNIGVESQSGVGSSFWIEIPLAREQAAAPSAAKGPGSTDPAVAENPAARPARQTLLYVEDNPANLSLVENLIRRRRPGIKLISAHNGELGLSLAQAQPPDLIMLDIGLPGMNGYELLERLRDQPRTRGIPVFAVSANAMPQDIEKGLAAGFERYLTKPLNMNELLGTLDALLGNSAAA